jgi:hypothetical protein
MQAEFSREREGILDQIRDLNKELKLKQFVVDQFIPRESLARIEDWASFDEEDDCWAIKNIQYAGNMQKRSKRSTKTKNLGVTKASRPQTTRGRDVKTVEKPSTFGPRLKNPYVVYDKNKSCGYSSAQCADGFAGSGWAVDQRDKNPRTKRGKKKTKSGRSRRRS